MATHKLGIGGDRIKSKVEEQAKDEGLWFGATTAPEAYLQQKLRELHEVIEKELGG